MKITTMEQDLTSKKVAEEDNNINQQFPVPITTRHNIQISDDCIVHGQGRRREREREDRREVVPLEMVQYFNSNSASLSSSRRRSSLPANISFGMPNYNNNKNNNHMHKNTVSRLSAHDQEKLEWLHQQTRHHRMVQERLRQSNNYSDGSQSMITNRSSFSGRNIPLPPPPPLMNNFPNHTADRNTRLLSTPPTVVSIVSPQEPTPIPTVVVDKKTTISQDIQMRRCSLDSSLMNYAPKRTCLSPSQRPRGNSLDLSDTIHRKPITDFVLGSDVPQQGAHSDEKEATRYSNSSSHREHQRLLNNTSGGGGGGGGERIQFSIYLPGQGANNEKDHHLDGCMDNGSAASIRRGGRENDQQHDLDDDVQHRRRGRSIERNAVPKIISLNSEKSVHRRSETDDFNREDVELGNPIFGGNNKKTSFRVTPLILFAACLWYSVSLVLMGGLGFWISQSITKDERNRASSGNTLNLPTLNPSYQTDPNKDTTMESKITPSTSLTPSSSLPSSYPSIDVTSAPSSSYEPTLRPSYFPSLSPTSIPVCPDELLNSIMLDNGGLLTFKYEVLLSSVYSGGGLFCASLEYAGVAGWIGIAFSQASRDPQFGLKEAVIGIPGIQSTAAVARGGSASVGMQGNVLLDDAPSYYVNPAKYLIPAGGVDSGGYLGPSLMLLRHAEMQTLINASVSIVVDAFPEDWINSTEQRSANETMLYRTHLYFARQLHEPNEIYINPYGSNLLLFAVAKVADNGEYDGNPTWQSLDLLLSS